MNDSHRRVLHLRSSGGMLGAEQVVLSLCRYSERFGYVPSLAVTHDFGDEVPALYTAARERGVDAHLLRCRHSYDLRALRQLRDLISGKAIRLLHCHGYRENLYAVLAASRTPKLTTNHLWKRTTPALRLYAAVDALLMRKFDRVVAVSTAIEDELRSAGVSAARLSYVPNGIDMDALRTDSPSKDDAKRLRNHLGLHDEDSTLIAVGSLTSEKGHEYLLRALSVICRTRPAVKLMLVGDGPLGDELQRAAERLGVAEQVLFLGSRSDVSALLGIADIFVLPSLNEGLPIALLEAMASGTACVATAVGDVPSVLEDKVSGIVVPSADSVSLAEGIELLLDDQDLRRSISQRGSQIAEQRYSAQRMTESYCRLYDAVLDAGPKNEAVR